MFTGLIADKAKVISISRGRESAVIQIKSLLIPEIKAGDSVSINGACLTATELSGDS
ncbi:MAG: riboflavin synthase, partial [Actinobacteria bacterium]|nr:riboflavin synthase [Actinomycetota bacterium]